MELYEPFVPSSVEIENIPKNTIIKI